MPEIFNKKFYLETGYKVTEEPLRQPSPEVQELIEWSIDLPKKRRITTRNIAKLKKIIQKYPNERVFRNHLVGVYYAQGRKEQAKKEALKCLEDFPDYEFAKLTMADIYIDEENFEAANKILGESRKIEDFVKDEIIHYSIFRNFQLNAAVLDVEYGETKMAEKRLFWVDEIMKDGGKTTKPFRLKILMKRMEESNKRFKKSAAMRRTVEVFATVEYEQKEEKVELIHDAALSSFYETIWKDVPDNFEQILALPRETLIPDLENILLDSIQRYDYFKALDVDWNETSFPAHAARFLGYLESVESISIILDMFRQGEEFLDFWYGDLFEDVFNDVLFRMGKNEAVRQQLLEFMFEENVYTYAKNGATRAIHQLVLSEEITREEGINWYKTVAEHFLNHLDNDNLIDTQVITFTSWYACEARLTELLPQIKYFFEEKLIDEMWGGDYSKHEEEANKSIELWDIRVQPSTLEEFYHSPEQHKRPTSDEEMPKEEKAMLNVITELLTGKTLSELDDDDDDDDWGYWDDEDEEYDYDYEEEKPVRLASPRNQTFIRQEKKVGRNDPCPCGSGKKYKKCHGRK